MAAQNPTTPPIQLTTTAKGNAAVLASELHARLGVKTPLRTWFPRMVKHGFEEGPDFYRLNKNVRSANGMEKEKFDWIMTLDMGKEVALLSNTDAGKAIRRYLIQQDQKVQTGALLSHSQLAVLMDLVSVAGFASMRHQCERMHYDRWGQTATWWTHRAKVLGYSPATLKTQMRAIGRKYKNQEQALATLEPNELVRVAVVDLFIGLGKSTEYALNMGEAAKLFAQRMPPLFDNDRAGGFDFKTPEQKRLLSTIGSPALLAKF